MRFPVHDLEQSSLSFVELKFEMRLLVIHATTPRFSSISRWLSAAGPWTGSRQAPANRGCFWLTTLDAGIYVANKLCALGAVLDYSILVTIDPWRERLKASCDADSCEREVVFSMGRHWSGSELWQSVLTTA